ncbi:unnamed protein product [Phytophthora fragariaefolia]|uniref:Unnamed protein product n=1 Tax=Phytophthora fragariaefolia TaxID=1490495 RepID=A0A9W6YLE0_9STRA|nr:unnamed protein product [Phytophthora fragariaefolia]
MCTYSPWGNTRNGGPKAGISGMLVDSMTKAVEASPCGALSGCNEVWETSGEDLAALFDTVGEEEYWRAVLDNRLEALSSFDRL